MPEPTATRSLRYPDRSRDLLRNRPLTISRQNSRSTSRRRAGAPGDFIADRPVNACIHPAGLPINTSAIKVLRRPVESASSCSGRDAAEKSAVVVREQPTCGTLCEIGHGRQFVALVDSADARVDDGLEYGDGQFWLRLLQFTHDPGERLVQ